MSQPINRLSPWGVTTETGEYVGVEDGGLVATAATIARLMFGDGSVMVSASSGLPAVIDAGSF